MSANILDEIAAFTRTRVATEREKVSLCELKAECEKISRAIGRKTGSERFQAALRREKSHDGMSFICEVKRASPSKGLIAPVFPYLDIAREYERAGADAISCLTEPHWFLGSDEIFREIRAAVKIPMLRKDFVVDEYQIYQARVMGADAVLLICAILGDPELADYLALAHELGLAAVVEAHDEREIQRAVTVGAKIIGVNNRNLKDFTVDTGNSARLRSLVPDGILFVAESGVKTPSDVAALKASGANAVLIGETLMRSQDKTATLREFHLACGRVS